MSKQQSDDKTKKIIKKIFKKLHIKLNSRTENLLVQIFKFGIVGGIAFIIDYSIMVFCKEVIGLSVLLSAFFGFTISVIYNYIASVKWVFDVDDSKDSRRNFILFIVFSVIGLILTELIMWFGTDIINISYLIVKIVATVIVMIFNFVTRKLFLE